MLREMAKLPLYGRLLSRTGARSDTPIVTPIHCRTFMRPRYNTSLDTLNVERLARKRRDYDRTRLIFLSTGSVAGVIATVVTAWQLKKALERHPKKLDVDRSSSSKGPSFPRKVIVHGPDGHEMVPTGNSTVPEFPRTINLPIHDGDESPSPASLAGDDSIVDGTTSRSSQTTEYSLVGLGQRTVSFLGIQVYVVGYYIATSDIAALQARLVKSINPIATTLVSGEKDQLRSALLDASKGEVLWTAMLQEGIPERSLFRITPVRDTDFHHLRDGFVRAIQARASTVLDGPGSEPTKDGPGFSDSMRQLRRIFNRGKVPKQKELLLVRGGKGALSIFYDDGKYKGRQYLGAVNDERLSRALWLNYLAGGKVASEPARKSIVEGVIEFVERPVGTVATQVI